jgi:protein-S-isoprenylcysteine O-methyltransferase Ste14
MTTFGWVRYVIALVLLVSGPGAVLFWFPVHPLAKLWRRVGYGWAYVAGFGAFTLSAVVLATYRRPLLSIEFGTSVATTGLGFVLIVAGGILRRCWRRQLTMRTLYGLPQLAPNRYPGRLLTEGVYAWVRHPRYLEVLVGFAGFALVSNYLAAYGVVLFLLLSFLVLIPLEERELVERFGPAYEDYRRRVPALIPRRAGTRARHLSRQVQTRSR